MSFLQKSGIAAGTVAVVLGLGFFVQSDESGTDRAMREANIPTSSSVKSIMTSKTDEGKRAFGLPEVTTSILPQLQNIKRASAVDTILEEVEVPEMNFVLGSPMDGCETTIAAEALVPAIVDLRVSSPCHPNVDFVMWHGGMAFSVKTDAEGTASVVAPALVENAVFVVTFDNIEEARINVTVPDIGLYDRSVLHWRGKDNLQLHALEFGAAFGGTGHVWSASSQDPILTETGQRGFMLRLGTSSANLPYWSEVYTFPAGQLNDTSQIVLQVGASVTEKNCGREVDARSIQTNAGRVFSIQELGIQMPGCDAVGQSVMHAGLFSPVTLAANTPPVNATTPAIEN